MSEEKMCQELCDFLSAIGYESEIKIKKGQSLRYPLYVDKAFRDTPIEYLNLSVRSGHALKRAGYNTIGDMLDNIRSSKDLKNIRNCGDKCVREIMEHLCLHQISLLSPEKQQDYAKELVRLNTEV